MTDRTLATFLLPIEKAERELDSKVVLAAALAGRGHRVVLGWARTLDGLARNSSGIIWLGKELFTRRSSDQLADHLIAKGSPIIFIPEEGAMFQAASWKDFIVERYHLGGLRTRSIDRLCTWGERQRDVVAEFAPELIGRTRVTGSPRFDISGPDYAWMTQTEAEEARATFGPYILMCSRFTSIASADGPQNMLKKKLNPVIWPAEMGKNRIAEIVFKKWRQDVLDFAEFIMLIKELALNRPQTAIIVRPHPSEDLNLYREALAFFDNVKIIRSGNVLGWIRGAELTIHSNCTTGVEAVLAGKPVLNLLPGDQDRSHLDVEIAREAGHSVRSVSEAIDWVDRVMAGERIPTARWSDHAASMLSNLRSPAIDELAAVADEVVHRPGGLKSELAVSVVASGSRFLQRWRPRFSRGAANQSPRHKDMDAHRSRIETLLDGCQRRSIGAGRIQAATDRFVVIDP